MCARACLRLCLSSSLGHPVSSFFGEFPAEHGYYGCCMGSIGWPRLPPPCQPCGCPGCFSSPPQAGCPGNPTLFRAYCLAVRRVDALATVFKLCSDGRIALCGRLEGRSITSPTPATCHAVVGALPRRGGGKGRSVIFGVLNANVPACLLRYCTIEPVRRNRPADISRC